MRPYGMRIGRYKVHSADICGTCRRYPPYKHSIARAKDKADVLKEQKKENENENA